MASLLGSVLVTTLPATTAGALTADLTVELLPLGQPPGTPLTSLPSAQFMDVRAAFAISDGTLQNAQLQLFFPRGQFRQAFPSAGGLGRTTSSDATGTTITYFLGRLTDGTIGDVGAQVSGAAYVPNGTVATVTARITGIGLTPPAPVSDSVTLTASAGPTIRKEVTSTTPNVSGPGPFAGQLGTNITYSVFAASNCGTNGTDVGCLPFQGTITETTPPQSIFVGAVHPAEYLERSTGVPSTGSPAETPWQFPAGFPNGANLSAVPAPGTPAPAFDVPVFLQPVNARMLSDGRYVQGDAQDDGLPSTPRSMAEIRFNGVTFATTPAVLEVTVWVPDSAVPPGGLPAVTNSARLRGPNGDGTNFDVTATASASIGVPVSGPGPETLSIVKDFRPGSAGSNFCRGYGNGSVFPVAAWDPLNGLGSQDCVLQEGTLDRFVFGIFTNTGTITDPVLTDVLPDELNFNFTIGLPFGWTQAVSTDPLCSAASPDSSFVPVGSTSAKVHCLRYAFDGVFNPPAPFTNVAFWEIGVTPDPAFDVVPGDHLRISNSITVTGTNPVSTQTVSQDVALVDRYEQLLFSQLTTGSQFFAGDVVTTNVTAQPDGNAVLGTNAPHDWVIQVEVPPELSFIDATVLDNPVDAGGNPITFSCTFDVPTSRLTCLAPGDARNNGGDRFAVQVRTRVRPGTANGNYVLPMCSFSTRPPGSPVNGLGQSLFWRSQHTGGTTCAAAPADVDRTAMGIEVISSVPPPPIDLTGTVLFDLDATRIDPLGEPIDPGEEVTYALDYDHQAGSDRDLQGAFLYDFPGRNPRTGAPLGDLVPEFVSAQATFPDGEPETLEFTCTPDARLVAPPIVVVWQATPSCGVVTGVRWQLNSTIAPGDPAGTYRVDDPAGKVQITVRVPASAAVGQTLGNQGGIEATGFPPAAGQNVLSIVGGDPPVVEDVATTSDVPGGVSVGIPFSDPDGDFAVDTGQILSVTPAGVGTATASTSGSPQVNFTADPASTDPVATVTYQWCDGTNLCDTGVATITLNHQPVAGDDGPVQVVPDGVAVIDTYLNDTDPDGDDLRGGGSWFFSDGFDSGFAVLAAGGSGDGDGVIRYFAASGFTGTDTATYQVCDGSTCDEATITVNVTAAAAPQAPTATDDFTPLPALGVPEVIDVVANDTDPNNDLDRASVTIVTGPTDGNATVDPITGAVTYDNVSAASSDTFTYEVCDVFALCDTATVVLAAPTNPPTPANDTLQAPVGETSSIVPATNDTDPDGDLNVDSVTIVTGPTQGTAVTAAGPTGTVVQYTPNAAAVGVDSIDYQICDLSGVCAQATINVAIVNRPVAGDDVGVVVAGASVDVDVLVNDVDADGPLGAGGLSITGAPGLGTASIVAGLVRYTAPATPAIGPAVVTYQVCDVNGLCDTATVTVTIRNPPVAVADALAGAIGVARTVSVVANDSDPDGNLDVTSGSIVIGPAQGTATIDATGVVSYTGDPGATADSLVYRICDTTGLCSDATVVIGFGDGPVAAGDTAKVVPGGTLDIDVLANDVDPTGDIDAASVTVVVAPGQGTATPQAGGAVQYVAVAGATGSDSFRYQVCDLQPVCATALVSITYFSAPDAQDDAVSVDVSSTSVVVDVLLNDSDADGTDGGIDPATLTITGAPASGRAAVARGTGTISYVLPGVVIPQEVSAAAAVGTDSFVYQVCDTVGLCDQASVVVTLTTPDPPVIPPVVPPPVNPPPVNPPPAVIPVIPPAVLPQVITTTTTTAPITTTTTSTTVPDDEDEQDDDVEVVPAEPEDVEIELSSAGSAAPGGNFTVTGSGCEGGAEVVITVDGDEVATTRAGDGGAFEVRVDEAPTEIGRHEVTATCEGASVSTSLDLVLSSSERPDNQVGAVFAFFVLVVAAIVHGREQTGRRAPAVHR